MNDQALRFRFGIFVLASLILLAVLTILFGGFPSYFKRTDSYTLLFDTAQGVAPGTPVKRSGVRIGEVRSVKLNHETGRVEIVIRIDEKNPIPQGDRPTLVQSLLGGDASIAFIPPPERKAGEKLVPVAPGSVLEGFTPTDAGSLVQQTSDLVGPAKEALLEIKKLAQGINRMGPLVEDTIKDFREIGKMVRDVGPEMKQTAEEFRALSKATRDVIPEIRKTNEDIGTAVRTWNKVGERTDNILKTGEAKILRSIDRLEDTLKRIGDVFDDENQKSIRETLKNAKNASGELDGLIKESRVTLKQVTESLKRADSAIADLQKTLKPLGEKGPAILKSFEETSDTLNRTLKDVRELIQLAARSEGTVSKLVFDPSLYNNLNDSATMVNRILPRLDRVLRDVEIFADKLARHPELIGIGGVVRPSSGVKETPMPYRIYPTYP